MGQKSPTGGGFAIKFKPPCLPQLPGRPPSRHVFLVWGYRDVTCLGLMSLSSWAILSAVKGTLLLLRKENVDIGASHQLAPWQTPISTRAVVHTSAGPSVIRAYMPPEGWIEYASPTPPRT